MKLYLSYPYLRNLGYLQVVYTMVVITLYIHYISSKFLNLSNSKRSVSEPSVTTEGFRQGHGLRGRRPDYLKAYD